MGTSAGGYAAILFGSICNVNHVISFIPQTILQNPYSNLKNKINKNTKYVLYGDKSIKDVNNHHHILHCENLECFPNEGVDVKMLRDTGELKKIIK